MIVYSYCILLGVVVLTWFSNQSSIIQALIATCFAWGGTALGALIVCFLKRINQKILDLMLGFATGLMIAAAFYSLLSPAIELSDHLGYIPWLWPTIGFLVGGIFVMVTERFLDKVISTKDSKLSKNESKKRSIMLLCAVTLHNIPEGLAIGVAFGGLYLGLPGATLTAACLLTLGISLQNFPEGAAISFPLRREGFSRKKSFFLGQLSGAVEPIAGIIGAIAAFTIQSFLPFLLSFAAGAMIVVCISELLPEATK